jgi:ketosteroid isomerase-like protein
MPYTYNNIDNPHPEIKIIDQVIRDSIGWAVNNKNLDQLYSSVIASDELFFFQTDSKSTIRGISRFKEMTESFFLQEDFKAIRYELFDLRISLSPSLQTAWFACLLDDFNTYKGRPANWEKVRWTGVLEKIDGRWKIFQMHFSKAEDLVK